MFWFVAFLLLALVGAAILWPLFGRERAAPSRAEHDAEVYGAQLRELRKDAERGAIPPDEEAGARAEIGRRLLKAVGEAERSRNAPAPARRPWFAILLGFLLLVGVPAALYPRLGAPDEPDLPLAARLDLHRPDLDIETLVAKAEARLRDHPEDGKGWDMLLPVYLQTGRADRAVTAATHAIRLLGSTSEREAMLGEALTQVAGGEVTVEAQRAFATALRLDPNNPSARFFLALQLSQADKPAEAAPAWKEILDRGPPDAPWMATARLAYADAEAKLGGGTAPAPPSAPGPAPADVAAAEDMAPADRAAMIEGMVAGLADRLKSAPNDAEGWKRLMRSYAVLGKQDLARDAYRQARQAFADGTAERGAIEDFAATLGLGASGTIE
ncbi:c-type cytochrome biogenesis protein CcmI [Aureimonas endophytica]|uniref:C-type cytochrome biogenesis protein CcmI n=1 Tax=Aureimonas endophytica TaxID=2027858 RepID=A0A916ZER4_9HYPH|nr:c-type cytochrome biogenesis protein CcmI [Aureimonas endophytica]GGD93315.1 c-type cytochrome biogenesis protein CcmI [Aureimonas endophytica]